MWWTEYVIKNTNVILISDKVFLDYTIGSNIGSSGKGNGAFR